MNKLTIRAGRGLRPDLSKEEFWREIFRLFAVRGQSVRAFCLSQGLSEPSFYSW